MLDGHYEARLTPTELRTQIYEYAVPSHMLKLSLSRERPSSAHHWANLLHVCRQTRAETLELYAKVQGRIIWYQSTAYVRTFFPSQIPAVMAEYRGRLLLDLGHIPGTPIDVLPLVRLLLHTSEVKISCLRSDFIPMHCYEVLDVLIRSLQPKPGHGMPSPKDNRVLSDERHESIHDRIQRETSFWYSQAMSKLTIYPHVGGPPKVKLYFRKVHTRDWMGAKDERIEDAEEDFQAFRRYLGLHNCWYALIDMRVDNSE
jgi:hypothetical protein